MNRSIPLGALRFAGLVLVAAGVSAASAWPVFAANASARVAPQSGEPAPPPRDGEGRTQPPAKQKPAPAKQDTGEKQELEELPMPKLAGADEARNEMIELFHQVEAQLGEIDKLLYDAGAGEALGDGVQDAGIDRLLRDAQQRSASAQQGIDRILELARQQRQQQQQSSSSGGGKSQQQGPSPLDQQQSGDPQQREKRPEGEAPEQTQPEGEEPQGGDPQQPKDSSGDPAQRQGARPPSGAKGGASQPGDDRERWGELPEQVRDVFRVQGGSDLPPRYRDFIDSYYRRMSKRP
ncbi:MAG: hypothetical protein L6Q99_11480 [Planctomycetes bacterium]|nr:hypothetical protein [Planctomycetota bacterium]